MKNIKDLRDDLIKNYKALKKGKMSIRTARELSNIAGKIIASSTVQLDYNKTVGNNNRPIKFLKSDE